MTAKEIDNTPCNLGEAIQEHTLVIAAWIKEICYQLAVANERPSSCCSETGVSLIAAERKRHVTKHGWTTEHDDTHGLGELIGAAIAYSTVALQQARWKRHIEMSAPPSWPWSNDWWKPSTDPIQNLAKAGALIAAEIDRLKRGKAVDDEAGSGSIEGAMR